MTKVKITKQGQSIVCCECDGHTCYGEKGEDIVCAALSSIVQTAVLGLFQVAGVNLEMSRDENNGYLKFKIPSGLSKETQMKADAITQTMLLGILDLNEGFSDFIEVEVN